MKPLINHPVKVFVTGFIVLLFLSLSLFWIRFACETFLSVNNMADNVRIEPSGLVPTELENDPNVTRHSVVYGDIETVEPVFLGIFNYFIMRFPGESRSKVYFFKSDDKWVYFDKKSGQLVCRYSQIKITPDKTRLITYIERYIGPEGVSTASNKTLGRFVDPIIDHSELYFWDREQFHERILYDKKLRQFFKIDFDKQTVVKGPKLGKKDYHKPIQIGRLKKNTFGPSILNWHAPLVPDTDDDENPIGSRGKLKPIIPTAYGFDAGPYLLVLDETGRIDLLDKETLELAGYAGWLPAPETYFGTRQPAKPKDLLSYDVKPIALNKLYLEDGKLLKTTIGFPVNPEQRQLHRMTSNEPIVPEPEVSKVEREYLGMSAASESRDGTALALAVFNAEGKRIKIQYTKFLKYVKQRRNVYISSSKAAFWEAPWAPVATIVKYLAENLHPPILSLASYFTAWTFEAGSGHRALFLLPNSFIAMVGRDLGGNFVERFLTALWWITPSIILSILLARCVAKDATVIGLTKNARLCWIIGTIAFGLTAYITYRLTKPKITLVTCQNCGKPRRPDMEKCHRCKSGWHVPELTPPAWRVVE